MFDKLMFWKHDEPEFTPQPGPAPQEQHDPMGPPPLGMQREGGMQSDPLGVHRDPLQPGPDINSPTAFKGLEEVHPSSTPPMAGPAHSPGGGVEKELEILTAKIDALRASVESMNQRIINIESIAKDSQHGKQTRW
jgi:hypothetical protein